MRSVASGSFERLSSVEALWESWLKCRRGKQRRPAIAAFDLNADKAVFALHRALRSGAYRPSPSHIRLVRDPKLRLVAAPAIRDRIVHTALLNEIAPAYEQGFIDQSYACGTGRGPHRAVLAYLQATRTFRYSLSLDIRRYFASIDHAILMALFAHRLKDEKTLSLLGQTIQTGGQVYQTSFATLVLGGKPVPLNVGLPLGAHLSHWSGGLYLDGLDHFVKRILKCRCYQRYMDDFTLFHDDPEWLEKARDNIADWLLNERRLTLKDPNSPVLSTRQPKSYLGFRVSPAGLAPGPKAKRRLKQRLKQGIDSTPGQLMRSVKSYRGLMLSIG
jgi:hypothetical protein